MMLIVATTVNWDSFWPDLIVGALTGLLVGAALWVAERVRERRQNRSSSVFAWESLKPRLATAAMTPWDRNLDKMTLPPGLDELHEIAIREPLRLWNSHFEKPDRGIERLLKLSQLKSDLEQAGKGIEYALGRDGMQSLADGNIWQDKLHRTIRARAYDLQATEANETIHGDYQYHVAEYAKAADEYMAKPRIGAMTTMYSVIRKDYLAARDEFVFLLTVNLGVTPAPYEFRKPSFRKRLSQAWTGFRSK